MKREPSVDFFLVDPKHIAIHERLVNWSRWSWSGGGGTSASPMFRLYRAPDQEDRDDLTRTSWPIDSLDAAKLQKGVCALPIPQRHAVNWHYVRPSNPRREAQRLAVTMEGLALLVRSARVMLINRQV